MGAAQEGSKGSQIVAPIVSPPSAVLSLAALGLRNYLRGRLIWGCYALLALPLAVVIPLNITGYGLEGDDIGTFFRVWATSLLPLAAVLIAYSGVSEEVESQTITYVFSRPLPRWSLPVGKLLTAWILAAPAACIFIGAGATLAGLKPINTELFVALILGSAVYCAMASTAGALVPKHAVFASLGLIAFLDMGLSKVPGFTQTLTPSFHVENLAGLRPPPGGLSKIITTPTTEPGTSIMALFVLTALFLMIAIVRSSFWEHRRQG